MASLRPSTVPIRPRRPARAARRFRFSSLLLLSLLGAGGLLWWTGPALLAPVELFPQGPGGAVAYVSVSQQIKEQSAQFWTGEDVQIRLNQEEFSGMLSSALLSGRSPQDPLQRVRGSLEDGEIKVESIIALPYEQVPHRFQGPLGLQLWLTPEVSESGLVQFRITRAQAGRLPISPALIRWVGEAYPLKSPSFDAQAATISLPLGEMVSGALGRKIEIKRFIADDGWLALTVAMPDEAAASR